MYLAHSGYGRNNDCSAHYLSRGECLVNAPTDYDFRQGGADNWGRASRRTASTLWTAVEAAKERIVGFYSTGPKIKPIDIQINHLFRDWGQGAAKDPVFVIIDVDVKQVSWHSPGHICMAQLCAAMLFGETHTQ